MLAIYESKAKGAKAALTDVVAVPLARSVNTVATEAAQNGRE
jgi:hypothetical protein